MAWSCPLQALTIDSEQQFQFAEALFNSGQYRRAAEEYQRFVFFFPEDSRQRPARLKAGQAFLMAKDPAAALDGFKALTTHDPNSATSQFFINVADNKFLNHKDKTIPGWGYAVFGRVIKGQDVVDKIKAVPTGRQGRYDDVPTTPETITKATIVSQ